MTTLENSYTVPMTSEEWKSLTSYPFWCGYKRGEFIDGFSCVEAFKPITFKKSYVLQQSDVTDSKTEIPVPRFLDLLHDIIVPWRLEEVGFKFDVMGYGFLDLKNEGSFLKYTSDGEVFWCAYRQQITTKAFITTFTDLLTLIRFLTPNTNKP